MKIDEPKTPFVRYNAETDTIEGGVSAILFYFVVDLILHVDRHPQP
jgi:hypothetical protein